MIKVNLKHPNSDKTHRTLSGYSAQALLMAYYDHTYPMALETDNGLDYRSKSIILDKPQTIQGKISILPTLIDQECKLIVQLNETINNGEILIISTDGRIIKQIKLTQSSQEFSLNLNNIAVSTITAVLKNNGKIIATARGIKQ